MSQSIELDFISIKLQPKSETGDELEKVAVS